MTVESAGPGTLRQQQGGRDHPSDGRTLHALVVDYGGVLTNPLAETFASFGQATGLSPQEIAGAMAHAAQRDGAAPMADLETARISERVFLDRLESALYATTGRVLDLGNFRDTWFAGRTANAPFITYLRSVRERGYRLALLTNNVIEWEQLWRATVPADDLFDLVVNSAEEKVRKPDPVIYERTLARLGLPGSACLFVDDVEENCAAAERTGMPTIQFETNEQAIADIELRLAGSEARAGR
jgi:putative hydrolase of the HAD superfamily